MEENKLANKRWVSMFGYEYNPKEGLSISSGRLYANLHSE